MGAGIDLTRVDRIILSHGHWDHADGLKAIAEAGIETKLLVHPDVFTDRYGKKGKFNGMDMDKAEAAEKFELTESAGPMQITDRVWFLGEIPRKNDFESQETNEIVFGCLKETS